MSDHQSDDWQPTATLAALKARATLLRTVREFFDHEGYWEVQTPLMSQDVCVDPWIEPWRIATEAAEPPLFLQTSPEFAMKRLLAAGAEAIYEITHSFRKGECGQRHNPEFILLEWYRRGDTYPQQMDFVERLVRSTVAQWNQLDGARLSITLPETAILRIAYDEAFERFAGQRVLKCEVQQLRRLAEKSRVVIPARLEDNDRDGWLNLLLSELVEPGLKSLGAVFVYDYPETQAALAQVSDGHPPVAERFELYLGGIEICNGYQELTDATELRRRMIRNNERRLRAGLAELPVESRLMDAMRHGLPACSGVALVLDRLHMVLAGAQDYSEVSPFPFDRA